VNPSTRTSKVWYCQSSLSTKSTVVRRSEESKRGQGNTGAQSNLPCLSQQNAVIGEAVKSPVERVAVDLSLQGPEIFKDGKGTGNSSP